MMRSRVNVSKAQRQPLLICSLRDGCFQRMGTIDFLWLRVARGIRARDFARRHGLGRDDGWKIARE